MTRQEKLKDIFSAVKFGTDALKRRIEEQQLVDPHQVSGFEKMVELTKQNLDKLVQVIKEPTNGKTSKDQG